MIPTKDIREEFRRLKPVLGAQADNLWSYYLTADEREKREILQMLPLLAKKVLRDTFNEDKIVLPPPTREQSQGEYEIGEIEYADKTFYSFGLREKEWVQHITIFGRSGCGKTNLVFGIIRNLIEKRKPFIIFDWKRNYRDLISKPYGKELKVFTVGRKLSPFGFNPLIPPPGTDPEIWLKKLVEIISHAYFLGEGVIYLLHKTIDSLYRKHGIYEGRTDNYPTMKDVFEDLGKLRLRGRESLWLSSTLRAIYSLCFGEIGNILCISQNPPMESLLKEKVVFELDSLTNTDKTFFIEALLLWIYHYRMSEDERESFKHAIIIEEAHHILLRRKQEVKGEETVTDVILREIRELGESLIIIDQHPSLISPTAIGNSYCTIAMNLKHRADINIMDDCMLLNNKEYFNRLPIGYGIVKLQGRFYDPFLIKTPLIPIKKGIVTDRIIQEIMKRDSGYSRPEPAPHIKPGLIPDIPGTDKLEEKQLTLLLDIATKPFTPVNERYKKLGWSSRTGNRISKDLTDKEYIKKSEIATPKGKITLFEILPKSHNELKWFIPIQSSNRKGGIEHRYWIDRIRSYYESQGDKIEVEKPIGEGMAVDLVINKTTAIEVETGKSDILANINKCLLAGFTSIKIIATQHSVYQRLKNNKTLNNIEGLEILSIKDFFTK